MAAAAEAAPTTQAEARPAPRRYKRRRDWWKWGLALYFVVFLIFIYSPMILMAILSFQGYYGGVTFPFKGPLFTTLCAAFLFVEWLRLIPSRGLVQ